MEYKLDYYQSLNKQYSYSILVLRLLFTLCGSYYIIQNSDHHFFKNDMYDQITMFYLYSSFMSIPINIHLYNYSNEYIMTGLHYGFYILLDTICISLLNYHSMTYSTLYKYVFLDMSTTIISMVGHVIILLLSYQKKYDNIATNVDLEDELFFQNSTVKSYQQDSIESLESDKSDSSNHTSDSFDIIDDHVFDD